MGGNRLNIYGFLINMRFWLYNLNMLIKLKKACSIAEKDLLQRIEIVDIDNFLMKCRVFARCKPYGQSYRLNIDGATKGNLGNARGGVIIRNEKGDMIASFYNWYGFSTNMIAKFKACLDGLRHYLDQDLISIDRY